MRSFTSRRPVEQSTDVSGGRGQVLEVVEDEQRARAGQGVADRVDQRLVGRLRDADRARDRAGHEVRIGDGSQADEVHGTLDGRRTRDLEREPALPGPAGPGDGDEPDVRAIEESADGGEVVRSADEAMMQRRKRGAAERAERREVVGQLRADELEQMLGARARP